MPDNVDKQTISKLFIKHSMHTNQSLINELSTLLKKHKQEAVEETVVKVHKILRGTIDYGESLGIDENKLVQLEGNFYRQLKELSK